MSFLKIKERKFEVKFRFWNPDDKTSYGDVAPNMTSWSWLTFKKKFIIFIDFLEKDRNWDEKLPYV